MKLIIMIFALIISSIFTFADTTTSYIQKDSNIVIVKTITDTKDFKLPINKVFNSDECKALVNKQTVERTESGGIILDIFPLITTKENTKKMVYRLDTTDGVIKSTVQNQTEEKSIGIISSIFFLLLPLSFSVIAGIYGKNSKALKPSLLALWISSGLYFIIFFGKQFEDTKWVFLIVGLVFIAILWLFYYDHDDITWVKGACIIIALSQLAFYIYVAYWGTYFSEKIIFPGTQVVLDYFIFNLICLAVFWITRWVTMFVQRKKLQNLTDVIVEVDM